MVVTGFFAQLEFLSAYRIIELCVPDFAVNQFIYITNFMTCFTNIINTMACFTA